MVSPIPEYGDGFPEMSDQIWLSSSVEFDLGWITGLYSAANSSIGNLYGDYEFSLNPDDLLDLDHLDFNDYAENSVGSIVYMAVWVAVALIFTILGICWCIRNKCLCCCTSSFTDDDKTRDLENTDPRYQLRPYYSERNDKKHSKHRTIAIVLAVLMAIWMVFFLIMIIHAFASNEKTDEVFDAIQDDLNSAFSDLVKYIDVTIRQMENTLESGYTVFERKVNVLLDQCDSTCDDNIKQEVANALITTETGVVTPLKALTDSLNDVRTEATEANGKLDTDFEDIMVDVNSGMYWGFMLFNVLYCIVFGLVIIGTVLATFGRGRKMKTTGYLSYRVAIVIMCIIFVFVVAQMIVGFVVGGVLSKVICPAVRQLEEGEPPVFDNPTVPGDYQVPRYGDIVRACKKDVGASAYTAFNLKQTYDIEEIKKIPDHFPTGSGIPFSRNRTVMSDAEVKQSTLIDVGETLDAIQQEARDYTDFIYDKISNEVGQCRPAYNAINATITLFCHKIVAPVTSLWFILQFIPPTFILIFATAIAFERFHF